MSWASHVGALMRARPGRGLRFRPPRGPTKSQRAKARRPLPPREPDELEDALARADALIARLVSNHALAGGCP